MPIEIRELVIRATVSEPGARQGHGDEGESASASAGAAAVDTDALVQECVRQVLEILARDSER
jgi:3-oxoacyl-ACP reductase-like protein